MLVFCILEYQPKVLCVIYHTKISGFRALMTLSKIYNPTGLQKCKQFSIHMNSDHDENSALQSS